MGQLIMMQIDEWHSIKVYSWNRVALRSPVEVAMHDFKLWHSMVIFRVCNVRLLIWLWR